MKNKFAQNLKLLRKGYGITQAELANRLNVTLRTLSHWETGYSEPSIQQLLELAEYFQITLDELITS